MSAQSQPISAEVLNHLGEKGISEETALAQIETFSKGIPFTELLRSCTIGDGIKNIDANIDKYVGLYESESPSKEVIKFVPASGAASRMFKELLAISSRGGDVRRDELMEEDTKETNVFLTFIDNIMKFAFYDDLSRQMSDDGLDIKSLLDRGTYKDIADYTLGTDGLNYANLPKGIIEFHKYEDGPRTAFEEHLVEAKEYSNDNDGVSRVHFTVSPEHLPKVKDLIDGKMSRYESDGVSFDISYSVQKPSTDTLAVDMDNRPFLDNDGSVVLRPGGHGALIENLNDLDCDIAFIKNIDNVVSDRIKTETYLYKKALGGYLLDIQEQVFAYLRELDNGPSDELIDSIAAFITQELNIELPQEFDSLTFEEKASYLRSKLDRPIRICGVVKNVGEPGGGPFWIKGTTGQISKQIVESAQVDLDSEQQKRHLGVINAF